jgi:hypothetical protein
MPTIPIFSQYIYVGQTQNNDAVLKAFEPYLLKTQEYFHSPWRGARCLTSCQHPKNGDLPWNTWIENIKPCLREFIEDLNPQREYTIDIIENWANIYYKDDFQEVHDHTFPGRTFSCSYFLEKDTAPDSGGEFCLVNDDFKTVKYSGIDNLFQKYFEGERYIPQPIGPGTLIIFPSWLKHYTFPNHSNKRRTTFSANFRINIKEKPNG